MTNEESATPPASVDASAEKMREELGQEAPPSPTPPAPPQATPPAADPVEERQEEENPPAVVGEPGGRAPLEVQDYCVRKIQRLKNTAGFIICTFRGISIPESPSIQKALKLGFDAEDAIRDNAAWLAVELKKNAPDSKIDFWLAIGLDAWLTWKAIGQEAAAKKPQPAADAAKPGAAVQSPARPRPSVGSVPPPREGDKVERNGEAA